MQQNAIEVHQLSKRYWIQPGKKADPYSTLRDTIVSQAKRWISPNKNSERKPFYALENVSFQIGEGESLGIVGNNGAGKSTLLMILSRITPPTSGSARLRGRVGSLL